MADKPVPGIPKLEQSVGILRGVGPAKKEALKKLGVERVGDLVRLWPRAYQNRGDTKTLLEIADRLRNGESGRRDGLGGDHMVQSALRRGPDPHGRRLPLLWAVRVGIRARADQFPDRGGLV